MLGKKDCVEVLLNHSAQTTIKNSQGWTSIAEAVSFGNREIGKFIVENYNKSLLKLYLHIHQ